MDLMLIYKSSRISGQSFSARDAMTTTFPRISNNLEYGIGIDATIRS